jgi:hypothetical protein
MERRTLKKFCGNDLLNMRSKKYSDLRNNTSSTCTMSGRKIG